MEGPRQYVFRWPLQQISPPRLQHHDGANGQKSISRLTKAK
jgi:hypothetical protein